MAFTILEHAGLAGREDHLRCLCWGMNTNPARNERQMAWRHG